MRRKRYRVFLIFLMVMIPGLSGCTAKTSMAGNTIPKSTAGSGDSVYESKAREYEGSEANDEIRNVMKNMAANTERVSCSHDGVELAIEIPDGWSHRSVYCLADHHKAIFHVFRRIRPKSRL